MERQILEEIKQMIEAGSGTRARLQEFFSSTHPADMADILEQLDEQERKKQFRHGTSNSSASFAI